MGIHERYIVECDRCPLGLGDSFEDWEDAMECIVTSDGWKIDECHRVTCPECTKTEREDGEELANRWNGRNSE